MGGRVPTSRGCSPAVTEARRVVTDASVASVALTVRHRVTANVSRMTP